LSVAARKDAKEPGEASCQIAEGRSSSPSRR
jgi:hypothetical protein